MPKFSRLKLLLKSTFYRLRIHVVILVFLCAMGMHKKVLAQWTNNVFGNEWINYQNEYLRIQVDGTGLHRLAIQNLPEEWRNIDPKKWQLWHRGKECPIVSVSNKELIFLGQTNDGASDSLVHRPASARLNQYQSLFSDQGVYFLTVSESPKRAVQLDATDDSGISQFYHLRKDTVKYNNQFAHMTRSYGNSLNQSYYDESNSWTGPTIGGPKASSSGDLPRELKIAHKLNNFIIGPGLPLPDVEMLFTGIYDGLHDIKVESIDENGLLKRVSETSFIGRSGRKVQFRLGQINSNHEISFKIHSVSESETDWFSLSYYTITYPQKLDMTGKKFYQFEFPPSASAELQLITIDNTPEDALVYDISEKSNIKILNGKREGNSIRLSVRRVSSAPLRLLVQSYQSFSNVAADKIEPVNFKPLYSYDQETDYSGELPMNPLSYDYLMICNNPLAEASIEYAKYRSSIIGGEHRVVLMRIRDIYDQFNYGEPSPVAIRSFVRFMLQDGIRENLHNLLLLGPSITYPDLVRKELPDEVPTFGDPGSDNLLVAGINGIHIDLQAIPVGRIKAFSNSELIGYLDKVRHYELESKDISWRKNVLHLSGGHSSAEISTLKSVLESLQPIVTTSDFGGRTSQFVKTITTVEKVNISKEVNEGIGLISYFGHGSQTVTDLDFGYATDPARGYTNSRKYPLMYFNGCGVGNIFTSRGTHILSDDWLIAKEKGAIAIIANSYLSYISPSSKHVRHVYKSLFEGDEVKTIGKVLYDANKEILSQNPSNYDIMNIHQAVLQGDPVLRLVRVDAADYLIDSERGLKVQSKTPSITIGESDTLELAVEIKNGGKVVKNIMLPIKIDFEYKNGSLKTLTYERNIVAYSDTLRVKFKKDEQISRIVIRLDPDNLIEEFSKINNLAEIPLDWEILKDRFSYMPDRDQIPPTITATFAGVMPQNKAVIQANEKIQILLRDDRVLALSDTNLIQVFIKPCWDESCDYQQLSFGSSLKILQDSDNERFISVDVSLPETNFAPGDYSILVLAKDLSGNVSEPYSINFTIREAIQYKIVVSPNPASDFVKFKFSGLLISDVSHFSFVIYSSNGIVIEQRESSELKADEWYWIPSQKSSGIYHYSISIRDKDLKTHISTGKIILR